MIIRVIVTTFPSEDSAKKIVGHILNRKMVACAQIEGPISSHYRWKGDTLNEKEWRVTMKTLPEIEKKLYQAVSQEHPYDTSQWVSYDCETSEEYGCWVKENVEP